MPAELTPGGSTENDNHTEPDFQTRFSKAREFCLRRAWASPNFGVRTSNAKHMSELAWNAVDAFSISPF